MISLNLLPPERKEMYFWRARVKNTFFWGSKILAILMFFCLPFLLINFFIKNKINDLNNKIFVLEQTQEMKQMEELGKSSQSLNDTLDKIDKISGNQICWTEALAEIIKNIPSGVQIFSLEITPIDSKDQVSTPEKGKFAVIGKAKTRDDVLALEKNLKSSENFENIESPLDNLVKRSEVEFKFTGNFILDNFKAKKKANLTAG